MTSSGTLMSPFDIINNITNGSEDISTSETFNTDYNAFMVNKGLSYFVDTILYANEMNGYNIPIEWQYKFLFYSVNKKKRFSKWVKKEQNSEYVPMLMEAFDYSQSKAESVLKILSDEDLQQIKAKLDKGGR